MRDIPDDNYYEKLLANFEQFCDEFEEASTKRFQGADNNSRAPITHSSVESVTPEVVREVEPVRAEDLVSGESTIDVQAT